MSASMVPGATRATVLAPQVTMAFTGGETLSFRVTLSEYGLASRSSVLRSSSATLATSLSDSAAGATASASTAGRLDDALGVDAAGAGAGELGREQATPSRTKGAIRRIIRIVPIVPIRGHLRLYCPDHRPPSVVDRRTSRPVWTRSR